MDISSTDFNAIKHEAYRADDSLEQSGKHNPVQDINQSSPRPGAVVLTTFYSAAAATRPALWGFFGGYKVVTMAGKAYGAILGGAYGACSAIKEAAFGENNASWASAKRSISDYAVRGANYGYLGIAIYAAGAGLWAGFKVTVIALPILKVAVPVVATLGVLGAIEYAVRGESFIQNRLVKVLTWLSPSNYFKPLYIYNEFRDSLHEIVIHPLSSLTFKELPNGVDLHCPILRDTPKTPVLVENPAGVNANGLSYGVSYNVYDYDELKKALKTNFPNLQLPLNRQPVDWSKIYRIKGNFSKSTGKQ